MHFNLPKCFSADLREYPLRFYFRPHLDMYFCAIDICRLIDIPWDYALIKGMQPNWITKQKIRLSTPIATNVWTWCINDDAVFYIIRNNNCNADHRLLSAVWNGYNNLNDFTIPPAKYAVRRRDNLGYTYDIAIKPKKKTGIAPSFGELKKSNYLRQLENMWSW